MSLVVPFRLTRCDVKESVVGRVFQRYSRGQDVKVLPLADVKSNDSLLVNYSRPCEFVRLAIKPGPTALTN